MIKLKIKCLRDDFGKVIKRFGWGDLNLTDDPLFLRAMFIAV